ncbi:DUF4188 domain-containing protein [Nocardioides sp. NPDC058538]|uniref:DUF4188 domain-containing protein n=1 Tax=Nocardioides sp. NPDC058538 TaxID=3346542 RepID=UPI00364F82E2
MSKIARGYREAPENVPDGVTPGHSVAEVGTDEVVVFLIGMRIHRWHKVRSWFPAFVGMPRMLAELAKKPDLGLLSARSYWSGRALLTVQYWRSVEDLGRFAKDPSLTHAPAWAAFNRRTASTGDIGIWHETYRVPADQVETLYGNMPAFGLGAALGVVERASGRRNATHERMGSTRPEYVETSTVR